MAPVRQRECDGGSWDYVGNCMRRYSNGGEFASERGRNCRRERIVYTSVVWMGTGSSSPEISLDWRVNGE